jgi:hypothetical protein
MVDIRFCGYFSPFRALRLFLLRPARRAVSITLVGVVCRFDPALSRCSPRSGVQVSVWGLAPCRKSPVKGLEFPRKSPVKGLEFPRKSPVKGLEFPGKSPVWGLHTVHSPLLFVCTHGSTSPLTGIDGPAPGRDKQYTVLCCVFAHTVVQVLSQGLTGRLPAEAHSTQSSVVCLYRQWYKSSHRD